MIYHFSVGRRFCISFYFCRGCCMWKPELRKTPHFIEFNWLYLAVEWVR